MKTSSLKISLSKPQIPYISNVTGKPINPKEVVTPRYWVQHLRQTVRFADGIKELTKEPHSLFLEIGPGSDLSLLVRRYIDKASQQQAISLIRPKGKQLSDVYYLLRQMGKLWLQGVKIDWEHFHEGENRNRVSLPTYPFEETYYWPDKSESVIKLARSGDSVSGEPVEPAEETQPVKLYSRPDLTAEYEAPTTETQRVLVDIYQNFLGIDKIGILDDFYELGIDSLGTISIGIEIFKELKVHIHLDELFECFNIKDLSEHISRYRDGKLDRSETTDSGDSDTEVF